MQEVRGVKIAREPACVIIKLQIAAAPCAFSAFEFLVELHGRVVSLRVYITIAHSVFRKAACPETEIFKYFLLYHQI